MQQLEFLLEPGSMITLVRLCQHCTGSLLQLLPIAYTLFSEFGSLCQNSTHKPIRQSTWRLTTHIYAKMKHCNQNLTLLSKNEILATKPYTQAPFELLFHITSNTLMGFI